MFPMFRSELFRARRRRQTWITIGIVLFAIVAFYVGYTIAHFARPDSASIKEQLLVSNAGNDGLIGLHLLGSIVAVVFGASLIGSEYGWNTMRSLVARAQSRASLLGAKWLAAGVYTVLLALLAVLTAYAGATVGSLAVGNDLGWSGSTIASLVGATARNTVAIAPYVALAVCAALITRSNAAGIAVGIAFSFVEPIIFALAGALSDSLGKLQQGGIAWHSARVTSFGGSDSDVSRGEMLTSILVLVAWIALFFVVSLRIFQRRDVTSG